MTFSISKAFSSSIIPSSSVVRKMAIQNLLTTQIKCTIILAQSPNKNEPCPLMGIDSDVRLNWLQ